MDATELMYLKKIATCFGLSFILFAAVSKIIGEERKSRWFRKRTKYSFFTRRSFVGEFIHYGYPCTIEGFGVFLGLMAVVFSFSYWYIFL
jgi:hypothetical protein